MRHIVLAFILFFSFEILSARSVEAVRTRCEYLTEPIGIDTPSPRFTWNISSDKPFSQSSYQIFVASDPSLLNASGADIWSSGIVASDDPLAIYGGKELKSFTKYYWMVEVVDSDGGLVVSKPATFETAMLETSEWRAQWISDQFDKEFRKAPMLRREFSLDREVTSARLYITGVGYYEAYINGEKVGDHLLDPGYTHFDKRVLYSTFDVTDMLSQGDNAIATILGNGWMNIQSLAVWRFDEAYWRMRPRMICQMKIEYSDGTSELICSDESWKTNSGAELFNNLYSGEHYDARLEKQGWKEAGYDDSRWSSAIVVDAPTSNLVAQAMPPIRASEQIKPISFNEVAPNRYVYDIGRNITGVCQIRIKGERGTRITLKHSELLHPSGEINQANIDPYFQRKGNDAPLHSDPEEIFQSDKYYLKGGGDYEEFTPKFTYHGFRYVELESSAPIEVSIESLTAHFIHTDVEPVGSFSCSNDKINKLIEASKASYLGNLHSIPTDCPQREKNGWTADAMVAQDLGLQYYDGITFYEKWFDDIVDNQRTEGNISGIIPSAGWGYSSWIGPVWDAAMFVMPNNIYSYYGDTRAIEEIYPTCKRYLEYLETTEEDGILTYGLGDWVYYDSATDSHFTSTAYYYLDNLLMAKFATIVGEYPTPYSAKAVTLLQHINDRWFDSENSLYANGTQAAQAVALALGLVPEGYEQRVADRLVEMIRSNNHSLDFGLLGSKFVPDMLVKYGYTEDAYKMITNPKDPSWISWIDKGLTTLPETWVLAEDFRDASLNHVFLGDVSAWMVRTIAGINYNSEKPGYRDIIIRPHFVEDLEWASASYNSVMGLISSSWERNGDKIELTITIPSNTTARLYIQDREISLEGGESKFTI